MHATVSAAEADVRVLLVVAVVVVAARAAGWMSVRVRQPRVVGEILVGIALGPSLLGVVWPDGLDYLFPAEVVVALRTLAQLGLVLFMFLIGLELDLGSLRGHGRRAVVISQASIVAPMVLAVPLALWLHPRLGEGVDRPGFVLFLGAAMAITAFPVLARILQETGLHGTRVGTLAITCAAVDDLTAWCVLAGVVAVVESAGPGDALRVIALSLAFVVAMLAVVRPLLARAPAVPVWGAVALGLTSAWATERIGVHAIFGAFMAGVVVPRAGGTVRAIEDRLETITLTLLLPVFFVVVGLDARVDLLGSPYLWAVAAAVIAVAVTGKWGGSMVAAKLTGESWRDAATLGVLMNTRGLTELVILSVGLELGVITTTMFTIMVLMALVTTVMTTPALGLVAGRRVVAPPAGTGPCTDARPTRAHGRS